MLDTLSLEAYAWVSYDHVKLDFRGSPLIVIRGKNLDAASREEAANRTGKSLIPAIMPRVRYDSVPQPVKAPKKSKNALRKGTRLIWDLKRGENRYRLEKYLDRTARVRIIEDKRNRGIRLKNTGDAAFAEIFPLNEDQFYSTVYIDARRPSLLQYGSDADRFKFFEQVYDLGIYRDLNDLIKPEVQASTKNTTEYEIIRDQLHTLGEKPDTRALTEQLHVKEKDLAEKRQHIDLGRSHERRLKVFLDTSAQIPSTPDEDIEALHKKMDGLSKRIDAGIVAEEQTRLYTETQEIRDKLQKALLSYKDIQIDANLPDQIASLRKAYEFALLGQEEYDNNCKELEQATAARDEIKASDKVKALTLPQLEREKIKAHSRVEFITRLQTALSGSLHHEKTCPVCANEFSDEGHAAFEARITKNLESAKAKARLIYDGIRWSKQDAIVREFTRLCKTKPQFDCEALEKDLADHESLLAQMRRKAQLTRRLNSLPKIKKPAKVENLSELRKQNRALLERVTTAERIKQARHVVASLKITLSTDQVNKLLEKYKVTLPRAERACRDLEENVVALRAQLAEADSLGEQIDATAKKLKALEKALEDQPILDALRHAFGTKGLIKQRTQKLALTFEAALNEYAPLVYCESVTFRLDVTETQFKILATRNGIEDDVRSLSGQESRAFSLIVMLSLMRFMPSHMRCSFICFDEVEANMDDSSRQLFVERFLPEARRFVKNILIITPLSRASFFIPGAAEYYAVKSKGKSTLVPFEDLNKFEVNNGRQAEGSNGTKVRSVNRSQTNRRASK